MIDEYIYAIPNVGRANPTAQSADDRPLPSLQKKAKNPNFAGQMKQQPVTRPGPGPSGKMN